jgi:tetratricopeptide (TPR) repeat protein
MTKREAPSSVVHLIELGYCDPLERREALRQDAIELESSLREAQTAINGGRVVDALARLEELSRRWPEAPGPRWGLAQGEFQAGNPRRAEEQLFWLQMHGFERAECSLLWARIALAGRRLEEALEHAMYARFLRTPLPAADIVVGEIRFRRGDLAAAEAAYQRALEHDARSAAALAGLAAVALRRGDYAGAVDLGLQSVELDGERASTHYRLGIALVRLGQREGAKAALEAATRINPQLRGPRRWLEQL